MINFGVVLGSAPPLPRAGASMLGGERTGIAGGGRDGGCGLLGIALHAMRDALR